MVGGPGSTAPELRRLLFTMLLVVLALDVAAVAIHTAARIGSRSPRVQYAYGGMWVVLTLAVVLTGLARIRTVRLRARHARAAAARTGERAGRA
jgi:Na+/pantothenate symporter